MLLVESCPPLSIYILGGEFSTTVGYDSPPLVGESSPPKITKRNIKESNIYRYIRDTYSYGYTTS
jgi:hypothetical protein